ncbi:MAG: ABC transporter substrate-binding protein [Solirubrobacterales bacterium]|nr:ABC transporter substrate-binding protein [Solirubrobacterales bacterium]
MTPHTAPRIAFAVAAVALVTVAVAMTSCGEKSEDSVSADSKPLDLALDFFVNPDHAGIYTGIDQGFFERAGLEVTPRVPSDPSAPIKEVAAGRADLAISYEPEVLLAREQGLDVIAVAALVDEPLTSLITLPDSGVTKPSDLQGKTVATAGIPYQSDYLATILSEAGVDSGSVEEVSVGFNLLPAILGGQADAILGGFRNVEGVDLALRGENPVVQPVNQLGVPTYDELVLVARESDLEERTEELSLFIAALRKGTAAAVADPAAAARVILANGEGLDPDLTRAEIEATLPLLAEDPKERFGEMSADEWQLFASWMAENGLIADVPPTEELFTNQLLP